MDVVVKEGGDATNGSSSSHTMLFAGLLLVGAVAGGVVIWWVFFRNKDGGGGGGDGPPKRENMKWAPGRRGNVEVLPDCTVLKGASDYAQAGRLCVMNDTSNVPGICKKGDDGRFSCVQRTTDLGGGSAADGDACKAQCDALEAQKPGSCYFADWYNEGGHLKGACLLRPLDASVRSNFCNWSSSDPEGWNAWAPEASSGRCPGLDQMIYRQKRTLGLMDNALGNGIELQLDDEVQCAAEAAQRTAAASKDKTVFVGSYSNGKCWIFKSTDPMTDCLANAPPSAPPSSYAIFNGQLQTPPTDCPNPWKAVEKNGDLTCNMRLRPKMRSGVESSLTCMEACQDPKVDGSEPTFAQPASQFFPDKGECWCYDWPTLPNTIQEEQQLAELVFCSDQTPGNPRLSSKPQPPVIVNTQMAEVTDASAQSDSKCSDYTYRKPTCSASYSGKYSLDTYCDDVAPGYTEVLSILESDDKSQYGIHCTCVEQEALNLGGPFFPAWGLPYYSVRPSSGDFPAFATSSASCVSGSYQTCDPPSPPSSKPTKNQFCQPDSKPGPQPESSPCVVDGDCTSKNCVCGQYVQGTFGPSSWAKKQDCTKDSAPQYLGDWKGCGICGPPLPSEKK